VNRNRRLLSLTLRELQQLTAHAAATDRKLLVAALAFIEEILPALQGACEEGEEPEAEPVREDFDNEVPM
jgi:hypothetical protein